MPTKKILALSLIEVMMVIVVFAIGIIAVVRLLSHNVLIAQMTHHRSQATMQAKEQLEMLYTFRDTNIKKGFPRNCVTMDTKAITKLDDTQVCKESMIDEKNLSGQWMIIQPSGDVRDISLRPIPNPYTGSYIHIASMSGMSDGHILSGRLYTVSSHVPYSYGAATGEVVVQSFLADI